MGASISKSHLPEYYQYDENITKSFFSEYCELSPSNFMDLNTLIFAFLIHAKFTPDDYQDLKKQILDSFEKHGRENIGKHMYVIGYPESKIIIGVKLNSWPPMSDDLRKRIYTK